MRRRLGRAYRGAARIGLLDILIIATVTAILLFASWKQFPAYDRPFTPRTVLTPMPRLPVARSMRTPAPH